jgi:GNAT superfamily N-acetyltransferase
MATLLEELGNRLVLRAARPDDAEQVVALNGEMHAEPGTSGPDEAIIEWTRDLFDLAHPTFRVDETTVVEDTATKRIVSTVFTIRQWWSYAGTLLLLSRPELVATDPAYRRRGLIRAQFDAIHRRGDSAGEMLQFITGIPWYYRQLGYDYALDLAPHPTIRAGSTPIEVDPRWSVRPATSDDIAFLATVDSATAARSSFLRCVRDEATWRLELARRPGALLSCGVFVIEQIEAPDGSPEPIGYAVHQNRAWGSQLPLRAFELLPGRSWLGPTAAVLAHAQQCAREHSLAGVTLAWPDEHPALRCAHTRLAPPFGANYGLYVRVPELPAFLRAIASVLDRRLEASPATNFSGDLHLDFYIEGLSMSFKDGRLASVAPWRPDNDDDHGDARMPRDAFVHMLLGNRTITELESLIADCSVNTDVGGLLLEVLFPRMPLDRWWLA